MMLYRDGVLVRRLFEWVRPGTPSREMPGGHFSRSQKKAFPNDTEIQKLVR